MRSLAVAARTPALCGALTAQSFKDWRIASDDDRVIRSGEILVGPCRWALVSFDDVALAAALRVPGTLVYWLVHAEVETLGLMLLESSKGGYVGVLISADAIRDHAAAPRRGSIVADWIDHVRGIGGRVGSVLVSDHGIAPLPPDTCEGSWRTADLGDAEILPPAEPFLFTCTSNDLYGGATVLRAYCGLGTSLPIAGRIQHGWEPGPGVVIQMLEDSKKFARYFVWSSRAKDRMDIARSVSDEDPTKVVMGVAVAETKIALIPIGAPYLYLPELPDPGPISSNSLLAVPGHGIVASRERRAPWSAYLNTVARFVRIASFSHVTVLLYAEDDTEEARAAVRAAGFTPATCGDVGHPSFLLRLRDFIRRHAAVTSDRICTAGMYALYENRPFYLVGAGTVQHDPPDAYVDLVCAPTWIQEHFPGIAAGGLAGGLAGRAEALVEMGEKLPPSDLLRRLYSWIWEGS